MILPNTSTFSGRIKYLRILRGLTQAELATRISTHKMTVYKWERGATEPRPTNLSVLAVTLGTTVPWLAEGKGEQPQ